MAALGAVMSEVLGMALGTPPDGTLSKSSLAPIAAFSSLVTKDHIGNNPGNL